MGDTVKYSPWTRTFYRIDLTLWVVSKADILCYFTSWFLFTFTSTNFSLHGYVETKSGTHTLNNLIKQKK